MAKVILILEDAINQKGVVTVAIQTDFDPPMKEDTEMTMAQALGTELLHVGWEAMYGENKEKTI